jgi:23S rRNA (adenine2503-C2)-methyltransferase
MLNLLDFNLEDLKSWTVKNNESSFRAKQIFDWIYKKSIFNFNNMGNLPQTTKEKLNADFYIGVPKVVAVNKSNIDGTQKFLFKYEDGNIIESVVMSYKHGNSICVSTQIGCKMGCSFCASTIGGIVRNLTSGEIIGQVLAAQKEFGERISNIVLMGSGEPLDNFDNVIKFIKLINSDVSLNIGQRHITLSTCGIVPKIKELANMNLQITLAISLHAPNDNLRKSMMPIANKYSLEDLIGACKYYYAETNRRITFEYALVREVNDMPKQAEELCKLLKGLPCHVNLIPINEIKENTFKKAKLEDVNMFKETLIKCGIETTVRREMGADINAACGQLRRQYIND